MIRESKASMTSRNIPPETAATVTVAEIDLIPKKVVSVWEHIVQNPEKWLIDLLKNNLDQKIAFVAGGGLPLLFGSDNGLWRKIKQSMSGEEIQIVGVNFTATELTTLGNYYRFMNTEGISLHCIDERCIDDTDYADVQVHEHCGACAAVAESILQSSNEIIDVETLVYDYLSNHDQKSKQPINPKMLEAHNSMVILIDLSGADVVRQEAREAFRIQGALPFNVSLPLDMVQGYIDQLVMNETEIEHEVARLMSTLIKWNVQIACNIIAGHHNSLHGYAPQTLFVVDERQSDGPGEHLKKYILKALATIEHGETVTIV